MPRITASHQSEASTSGGVPSATATSQQGNAKYRAYVSAVDKALKSFENTTEWPDLIAALGKLGKVFSSYAKSFNEIPNAVTVAKRLSQCLHPHLTSGVHTKALEIYRQVFMILGKTENLPRYLYLFAIGLFPLMNYCGIKVKKELLSIFEQFLLPLGARLRPALPGFIAAVLLGVEEGTEFYERSTQLLDNLIENVGAESFYTCFWQAVHGSSSVRLPALMFLNGKLDKRKATTPEQIYVIAGGCYPSHMIAALVAVAEDPGSTLIQRHLLDLLGALFPLDSENISQADLVQIVQRCLFVLLRREMNLNRRLYQWLLNRLNDSTFAGIPLNGTERDDDMKFLRKHSLPLIKLAVKNFLKSDIVEMPQSSDTMLTTGTLRAKDAQIQFTEVRVCRLMRYFLDRREVGMLVMNEILAMFLEFSSLQDAPLINDFNAQCAELDPAYEPLCTASSTANEQLTARRVHETKKNFNALLNVLDNEFMWDFLGKYFVQLLDAYQTAQTNNDPTTMNCSGDESALSDSELHLKHFPLIVVFCLKTIQLDAHGDIRGRHLTDLLKTIMTEIRKRGCDAISRDVFVAVLVVARRLLHEINQNVSVFEMDEQADLTADQFSTTYSTQQSLRVEHREDCIEEQRIVESALGTCFELLSDVCQWFVSGRDRDKAGVLSAMCALIRDFADFPFYCFQLSETRPLAQITAIADISRSTSGAYPIWMASLTCVVDVDSWVDIYDRLDFEVRAKILDIILYMYVRSSSVIDQHHAVNGRSNFSGLYDSSESGFQKTTTTVLLKPFLAEPDLNRLENDGIFKKAASVLWTRFDNCAETFSLEKTAFLLLRVHSRRVVDSSSEVEDIIVSELTASDKAISGLSARKFRDLWIFCRTAGVEDVYTSVPLKPMNRIVMVLLGFIADDTLGIEHIELRAIAYAWFVDCSRHNDLYKILQMLMLMLVNPATARISMQHVQVDARITRDQLPVIPRDINTISLALKSGGKQKFHHVCHDIDATTSAEDSVPPSPGANFTFIDCDGSKPWVSELNKLLLLPTSNFADNSLRSVAETASGGGASTSRSAVSGSHKRTVSDIPQFDEDDAESVSSLSLDSTMEHEVYDVLQFIVDTVVDDQVTLERADTSEYDEELANVSASSQPPPQRPSSLESTRALNRSASFFSLHVSQPPNAAAAGNPRASTSGLPSFADVGMGESAGAGYSKRKSRSSPDKMTDITDRSQLRSLPDTSRSLKHIKSGHRRQDSLQESIFNVTSALFDPSELPTTTSPGDAKQPLLDETHSHMLFYAESPRIVDLGRAEKIFRTIGALLKSGVTLERHIVNCLIFTNATHLKSGSPSQLVDYMLRHIKHMQTGSFWLEDSDTMTSNTIYGHEKNRNPNPTMFEIFSTILLYYIRSYYLNSPTNRVTAEDLILSWKCKIAALDCFTELLRILNDIVREVNSKDFVTFVQQIYRYTKTQRVLIVLMLAAVPLPSPQKDWKIPISTDIAEFNNGPPNQQFQDLIFAYQRSLLNFTFSLIVFEFHIQAGVKNFAAQSLGFYSDRIVENRQLYNSPANRSTVRDPRTMFVELRLFMGVTLNALMRCPERHELWLQFLISSIPYWDRALPALAVHIVEQICRNIYAAIGNPNDTILLAMRCQSPVDAVDSPRNGLKNFNDFKSSFYFADFRLPKREVSSGKITNDSQLSSLTTNADRTNIKYPANYPVTLMESLMSILHFCMIDTSTVNMPFLMARTSAALHAPHHHFPILSSHLNGRSALTAGQMMANGMAGSPATSGGGGGSSNMVGSMVGSAISVIPGTTAISNLFGKVFTSSDNTNHAASVSNADTSGNSEHWIAAQKELIKIFPSALAILCDAWAFAMGQANGYSISNPDALIALIVDTLNPIAKKRTNALINAFGIVWISRQRMDNFGKKAENPHPSFVYSPQQISTAKLLLSLKVLPLNSIIVAVSELLRNYSNKVMKSIADKSFLSEVALLELLHECTRQVSVGELRESWSALNILFNESPLSTLPARASFLEFMIFSDVVRRCGSQTVIDDRNISRAILDVCLRLTDAVNSIVGWQLETTTWLKRTLVVRQDAGSQKISDISPTIDLKNTVAPSEVSSMRGSTISLAQPNNRMSSLDGVNQFNGSVAQLSLNSSDTAKRGTSNLRSSLKDSSSHNKKDPTDSTQALFLLADNLAELVDSICKSEDKEKLLPTLQAVWGNTLPYLKVKNAKNVRFFLASSQFLASMSSYNYMRPVWKKATMDFLLDSAFFKMDINALRQWLIVIDNLMTNDKTSFKELIARVATGASSLSNLITSKEQEYEVRAQSLKRLAFVILSSELDQYSSHLNDIQEKLTENLRVTQVPIVHVQVFTCYRVLLVRMQPTSFVSMWPSMVTELVQVLSQMEQQLQLSIGANKEGGVTEDLKCSRDDHWMQLYLAACKLLETLCTLPCGYVAQFQMSRWAFVSAVNTDSHLDVFVPFAVRINNLLNVKYSEPPLTDREIRSASLFNVKTLTSFQELHPFFYTLATQHANVGSNAIGSPINESDRSIRSHGSMDTITESDCQFRDANLVNGSLLLKSAVARIEQALYVDFADHWQL